MAYVAEVELLLLASIYPLWFIVASKVVLWLLEAAAVIVFLLPAPAFQCWLLAESADFFLGASALKSWSLADVADSWLLALIAVFDLLARVWAVVSEVQTLVLSSPDAADTVRASVRSISVVSTLSAVRVSGVPAVVLVSSIVEASDTV